MFLQWGELRKGEHSYQACSNSFLFKYKIICASKYCNFECDRESNAWKSIDNCIDKEECKIIIKTCCKSHSVAFTVAAKDV